MNEDKDRFNRLLHAMATKHALTPSGTPEAECPASDAGSDACCDDTQTPTDTSASAPPKRGRKSRNPPLDVSPEAFDRIGVHIAAHIFFRRVVHRFVDVVASEARKRFGFVGHQPRTRFHRAANTSGSTQAALRSGMCLATTSPPRSNMPSTTFLSSAPISSTPPMNALVGFYTIRKGYKS